MPYKLVRIPVRAVVLGWVNSSFEKVEDAEEGDDHEILPEQSLFDAAITLTPEDGARLYYWISKGYYPVVLVNKP